jgi:hypothetical protein
VTKNNPESAPEVTLSDLSPDGVHMFIGWMKGSNSEEIRAEISAFLRSMLTLQKQGTLTPFRLEVVPQE